MSYLKAYMVCYGVETGDAERGPAGYYVERLIYAECARLARKIVEHEYRNHPGFCGISEIRHATLKDLKGCMDQLEMPFA